MTIAELSKIYRKTQKKSPFAQKDYEIMSEILKKELQVKTQEAWLQEEIQKGFDSGEIVYQSPEEAIEAIKIGGEKLLKKRKND